LQSFIETFDTFTRKIGIENEVSQSVCNIKKEKHKFYSYKMHYVQKLIYEDFNWIIEFCELINTFETGNVVLRNFKFFS